MKLIFCHKFPYLLLNRIISYLQLGNDGLYFVNNFRISQSSVLLLFYFFQTATFILDTLNYELSYVKHVNMCYLIVINLGNMYRDGWLLDVS